MDIPRQPSGSSAEARFDQRTHEELYTGKNKIASISGASISRTTRGLKINAPIRIAPPKTLYYPFKMYQAPQSLWGYIDAATGIPGAGSRTVFVRDGVLVTHNVAGDGSELGWNFPINSDDLDWDTTTGGQAIDPTHLQDMITAGTLIILPATAGSYAIGLEIKKPVTPGDLYLQFVIIDLTTEWEYPKWLFYHPYRWLVGWVITATGEKTIFQNYLRDNIRYDNDAERFYGDWASDVFGSRGYPRGAVIVKDDTTIAQGIAYNYHSTDAPGDGDVNSRSVYFSEKWFNKDDPYTHNETAANPADRTWRRIAQFRKL